MKLEIVNSPCSDAHSCLTLCNPMDSSPSGSFVHEILQARILEWVAIFFPRDLSDTRIKPKCLMSPALAAGFFTSIANWEAIGSPSLFFFFKIVQGILDLLQFLINFRIKLLTSAKIVEILIETALNL